MTEQSPETPESSDRSVESEQDRIDEMVELANRFMDLAKEFAEENIQFREENAELTQKNADLEAAIAKAQEQIKSLKSQIALEQKNFETLKQGKEKVEEEIEKLKEQIKNLDDQLKIEKGKVYETARQLEELSKNLTRNSTSESEQDDQTITSRFKALFVSSILEKEQNQRYLQTLQDQFPQVEWKLLEVPTRNRFISKRDFIAILGSSIKSHKDTDWIKQFAKSQEIKITNRKSIQKLTEGITILLSRLPTKD